MYSERSQSVVPSRCCSQPLSTGSGLLDLSFDVRRRICSHVFKSPTQLRRVANLNEKVERNTFNISRQIYGKALRIFYAVNDFTVDVSSHTSGRTLKALSPLGASYMKRLRIQSPTAHSYGSWSLTQSYHNACRILMGQMPRLQVLDMTMVDCHGSTALLMSLVRATATWIPSAGPTIELAMTFHQDPCPAPGQTKNQPEQSSFWLPPDARAVPFRLPASLRKVEITGQLVEADCWELVAEELARYELRGPDARYVMSRDKLESSSVQLAPNMEPDSWRQLTVRIWAATRTCGHGVKQACGHIMSIITR